MNTYKPAITFVTTYPQGCGWTFVQTPSGGIGQ